MGRNANILRTDISSSAHIHNKGKVILILGEEPTKRLHDTTSTVEAQSNKTFASSLNYNRSNSLVFVNAKKIYQFKAKSSEIKDHTLYLGNISKDFTINNMKKIRLNGVSFFSDGFNPIDTNIILDIHKNFMKKT